MYVPYDKGYELSALCHRALMQFCEMTGDVFESADAKIEYAGPEKAHFTFSAFTQGRTWFLYGQDISKYSALGAPDGKYVRYEIHGMLRHTVPGEMHRVIVYPEQPEIGV